MTLRRLGSCKQGRVWAGLKPLESQGGKLQHASSQSFQMSRRSPPNPPSRAPRPPWPPSPPCPSQVRVSNPGLSRVTVPGLLVTASKGRSAKFSLCADWCGSKFRVPVTPPGWSRGGEGWEVDKRHGRWEDLSVHQSPSLEHRGPRAHSAPAPARQSTCPAVLVPQRVPATTSLGGRQDEGSPLRDAQRQFAKQRWPGP